MTADAGSATTLDGPMLGIVPARTDDPARAAALVHVDGAAILTGRGTDEAAAREVAADVLGEKVVVIPPPAPVREGGEGDRLTAPAVDPLPLHSDGFAYGDRAPDLIALLCVIAGDTGGESFLADGTALLAHVQRTDPELHDFLFDVPVDLTEPGMATNIAPIVLRRAGHPVIRRLPFMVPAPASADPRRDTAHIERWRALTQAVSKVVPRFALVPGEALVVDNERVLHGRESYEGERFLWRIWAWSTDGPTPPEGELHSDSRYAVVDPDAALTPTHVIPMDQL